MLRPVRRVTLDVNKKNGSLAAFLLVWLTMSAGPITSIGRMQIPLKKSAGGIESNGMPSRAHYKRVRSVRSGAVRRFKPTFSAESKVKIRLHNG